MKQRSVRRLTVAGTALLAAVLLAGCGGNDHDGANGGQGSGHPASSASGNATFNAADVKFVSEMIAHHQQALEMAQMAEGRASNAKVKELCACRIPRPCSSSGMLILVKDTAESVSSAYVEVGDSSSIRDRCGNSP